MDIDFGNLENFCILLTGFVFELILIVLTQQLMLIMLGIANDLVYFAAGY